MLGRAFRDDYDHKTLSGLRGGLLLLASRHPRFHAVWEPAVVASFCLIAWLLLGSVAHQAPPPEVGRGPAAGALRANTLLLNEMQIVIVGFALTRLRFVWLTLGTLLVSTLTLAVLPPARVLSPEALTGV